jgi:hypothetical protein
MVLENFTWMGDGLAGWHLLLLSCLRMLPLQLYTPDSVCNVYVQPIKA